MSKDPPHEVTEHRWRLPFDQSLDLRRWPTAPPKDAGDADTWRKERERHTERMASLQEILYAHDSHAVLCVLQGMDSAGKDSSVRKVFSGVNPAGCNVYAFSRPTEEELEHDFLWRVHNRAPRRGRIAVFNRSHYEDVVTVRVKPELLQAAGLRSRHQLDNIWSRRFRAIRELEHHLADNGTVIVKVFLHLGKDEQRKRLLARLDNPKKRWKADPSDVEAREAWGAYREAYEEAITETNRPWAPWYVIPADDKRYLQLQLAELMAGTLGRLEMVAPEETEARTEALERMRERLG